MEAKKQMSLRGGGTYISQLEERTNFRPRDSEVQGQNWKSRTEDPITSLQA